MFKKRIAIMLAFMMVLNLFTPFISIDDDGGSFAETNPYYEYDPDGQSGSGYYFHDGTAYDPENNTGNVFFQGINQGEVMVQDYDVADIGWLQNNQSLWSRDNMYRPDRVVGSPYPITGELNDGYGNTPQAYDTDYVFFKSSSWNGSIEQGGMSKTARRIWGYFTPDKTGYYRFRIDSDDGHYMNFYSDDIFFDPKYDHYDDGTYEEKWERFYENGIKYDYDAKQDNLISYVYRDSRYITPARVVDTSRPQGSMQVSGNMISETVSVFMTQGEVYPFYIEYFNWGGGGKFYFRQKYSANGSNWSGYSQVSTEDLYPAVANIPREPGNSGLDLTVEDGIRTVHGYDNFNDDEMDTTVWENNSGFVLSNRMLKSTGGISSLKLKGDYENYDSYNMHIDLVNVDDQDQGKSNGGLGISGDNALWSHHVYMDQGVNNDKWYRTYNITKSGSIDAINPSGDSLGSPVQFDEMINPDEPWQNTSIRISIDAVRVGSTIDTYDVTTNLYYANSPDVAIKTIQKTYTTDQLDFGDIMLTAIEPDSDWSVALDNFDFVAEKNLKFDTLKADWDDGMYTLSWDLIPGATEYIVKYQDGINTSGQPIIKDYVITVDGINDNTESIKTGKIYIPDSSTFCNHPYKIVAKMNGYEISSNKVYIAGAASDLNLNGGYNGDNYTADWDSLVLALANGAVVDGLTYSLYYEDDNNHMKPVEGAQSIPSTKTNYVFQNLQTSSKYYGKKIQVYADVDFGYDDLTRYYSNKVQIKAKVRLDIDHANDQYVLGWKSEADFDSYRLHRNADKNNYSDLSNVPAPYDNINNDAINKRPNGYIYYTFADTNTEYINKHYIVGGNANGNMEYSNIKYAEGDETVPTLHWIPQNGGLQLFSWDAFPGATDVKLYYGSTADNIENLMSENPSLLADNKFESSELLHEDKYVQARYYKNGIWYYSNIVKTTEFDDIGGVIGNNVSDSSKYDFEINWQEIQWPEDGNDASAKVSYYELYYVDDTGQEVLVQTNIKDNQYTITDIYGDNNIYLNKKMFVKAVCPITDKFGFEYKAVLQSPNITPREIRFDQLDGLLGKENKYTITWEKPVEISGSTSTDVTVSSYNVLYGATKETISTYAVKDLINLAELKQEWADVTETGTNKAFYHKFFKIEAKIDGVSYLSNTAYSGEAPELYIDRYGNNFKLNWEKVEHADAIRVYYADKDNEDDYELYDAALLDGNSVEYTLEKLVADSALDNKYYKIAAVFDGFEIKSNAVKINVSDPVPVLKGKYDEDSDAFKTTWETLDWAEGGYQFYYENELTDESDLNDANYNKIDGLLLDQSKGAYDFTSVESNPYNGKYVRIQAIDGNLRAYSNAVNVQKPAFSGELDGITDSVELQLSDDLEVVYTFDVYEDMVNPYFKIVLNGTKYLNFESISASLENTGGSDDEEIPVRVVSQLDEETGVTTLYVHYVDGDATLKADAGEYKLTLSYSIEVNGANAENVYDALRNNVAGAENWELPYHIYDDKNTDNTSDDEMLKVGDEYIANDMYMQYEAYWNSDNRESVGNQRQASKELFKVDVKMLNKKQLPSSL